MKERRTFTSAHTGGNRVHVSKYNSGTSWGSAERVGPDSGPTAHSAPALGYAQNMLSIDHRKSDGAIYTWRKTPLGWAGNDLNEWRTHQATTMHNTGEYGWLVHRGLDGRSFIARRFSNSYDQGYAAAIEQDSWQCNALAAPVIADHQYRMYTIYHA